MGARRAPSVACPRPRFLQSDSCRTLRLPRHPNAAAERALQEIAAPLSRVSTRKDLEWRIGLLKVMPQNINAFTCGGGIIFVHDALIAFCSNETELIGYNAADAEIRAAGTFASENPLSRRAHFCTPLTRLDLIAERRSTDAHERAP